MVKSNTKDAHTNGEALGQSGGKPKTRQRLYKEPVTLEVPDIDEDAAERKRVLNVLAQRRYRQKKRQERLKSKGKVVEEEVEEVESLHTETLPEGTAFIENIVLPTSTAQSTHISLGAPEGIALPDLEYVSWESLGNPDISTLLDTVPDSLESFTGHSSGGEASLAQLDLSNTYTSSSATTLSSTSPSSFESLSSTSDSDLEFIDSYLLPVHELTLLKAFQRIAARLGCNTQNLWTLDCLSPFNQGIATPSNQLPEAWRPTVSQVNIPHHPLLDFMPWPSVRDKILMVFSMPESARPPTAQGPLALVNFAYDFENNSEGVRIYGADPYDPDSWEVGQILFERWWFLFDRDIIETSNKLRELRGAPQLLLKGSTNS